MNFFEQFLIEYSKIHDFQVSKYTKYSTPLEIDFKNLALSLLHSFKIDP
jgi:hypothetical protein